MSKWKAAMESAIAEYLALGLDPNTVTKQPLKVTDFGLPAMSDSYNPTKKIHNYLIRYDHVFGPIRHSVRKMVEIGVQSNTSIRMWKDYFPNAQIIGVDIDEKCREFETDRIQIVIGNQMDPKFLRSFGMEHFGTIDILVDDGAHSELAITRSFTMLYPTLSSHGIYAIEDLLYGQTWFLPEVQALITAINFWPRDYPRRDWSMLKDFGQEASWLARHTIGMEFYRYILFVKRGFNPQDNPYLRDIEQMRQKRQAQLQRVAETARLIEDAGALVTADTLRNVLGPKHGPVIDEYLATR